MDFFVSFPEVHRGLVDLHTHTHLYFYTCEVPDALLSEPRPKSDTLLRFITFCWSISILNAIFFLALTALVYWPQIIWRGATQPIKSEHLEKQGDCNSSVSDTWTVKEKVFHMPCSTKTRLYNSSFDQEWSKCSFFQLGKTSMPHLLREQGDYLTRWCEAPLWDKAQAFWANIRTQIPRTQKINVQAHFSHWTSKSGT